jgi:hypothetical protein
VAMTKKTRPSALETERSEKNTIDLLKNLKRRFTHML